MLFTSQSGFPPLTVKKLRKLLDKLPDNALIICEDGSYRYSTLEEADICRYISLADDEPGDREFVPDRQLKKGGDFKQKADGLKSGYEDRVLLELKVPVLYLAVSASFGVPGKDAS